jgi:type IV pilus assembly protein PilA
LGEVRDGARVLRPASPFLGICWRKRATDSRRACPSGFTLIEVLIALAIFALLALLAVPSYEGKYVRDEIVQALPLAQLAEGPVAASWSATHQFPANNAAAGLPVAEKIVNNFVSATAVENGAVQITFGNRAHGKLRGHILSFRPAVVEDAPIVPVTWVCGYGTAPNNMTLHGTNRTDIPMNYLPVLCRSLPG